MFGRTHGPLPGLPPLAANKPRLPNTVPNGFTGRTSFGAFTLVIGNGTSALTTVAPGADGQVLTSTSTASLPEFEYPPGGVYLGSLTANSSNTLDWTANFSQYETIYLAVRNLKITTGLAEQFTIRFEQNGIWSGQILEGAGWTYDPVAGAGNGFGANGAEVAALFDDATVNTAAATNNVGVSLDLLIEGANNTASYKDFRVPNGRTTISGNRSVTISYGGQIQTVTQKITGVRLAFGSNATGIAQSGSVHVYGITIR